MEGSDDDFEDVFPAAKVRCLDWKSCLCHSQTGSGDLKTFQTRSWRTLHDSADIRKDDTYMFLRKEGVTRNDNPRGFYHRLCYQNYTNKTNLTRLQNKRRKENDEEQQSEYPTSAPVPVITLSRQGLQGVHAISSVPSTAHSVSDGSVSSSARTTRRSMAKTNFSLCLLCQQLKKLDKHNYERLSDYQMDSSPGTLVQAARIRDDTRVLLATEDGSLDFHAAEVKYHASCYRDYTSKINLACVVRRHNACKWEENSTAGDVQERTAFAKAFSSLVYSIETKVICGKHSQNVTTSF